jgi:hypothetical protein
LIQPGEQLLVERLTVASQLVYMPVGPLPGVVARHGDAVIDADGFSTLLDPFKPRLEAMDEASPDTRVYLPRPIGGRRQMVGAQQIGAVLEQRGYRAFSFADLDFAQQLRIIRGADAVVGPDGSALMMTLFGRAGLKVGVFTHPYLEEYEWYTQASAGLDHDLTVLTGSVVREDPTYRTFSDYRIDPDAATRFLDGLEEREGA